MDCAEPRAEPPQVSAPTPRRADGLKIPPIMPTNQAVRPDAPQERAAAEGGEAFSSAASVAESDGATAAAAAAAEAADAVAAVEVTVTAADDIPMVEDGAPSARFPMGSLLARGRETPRRARR